MRHDFIYIYIYKHEMVTIKIPIQQKNDASNGLLLDLQIYPLWEYW